MVVDILSKEWSVTTRFGIPILINSEVLPKFENGVSLDIEHDGKGNFVGIGIFDGKQCYYWSDWNLVSKLTIPKFLAHNGKTDLMCLINWGFSLDSSWLVNDTIIASYCADITRFSHSLKEYASELGMPYPKYEDIVGKGAKKITLDKQPLELVTEYNACDCVATYKLWEKFKKELPENVWKYYNEIEMPICRLLVDMQLQGVKVNTDELKSFQTRLQKELCALETKFFALYGSTFNPRSSKQLKEILHLSDSKKTTLIKLKDRKEIADILRYKKLSKLISTYINPYIESKGELHPEFNQVAYSKESKNDEGIRTGRLSSRNPNFQNLPSHTEEGLVIRTAIVPRKNHTFILADYSQIELRILAHFCEDPKMITTFNNDGDIHKTTAESINAPREVAKTINFAIVYGSGIYNLHEKTGISLIDATDFMTSFELQFPDIFKWKRTALYNAHKNGYVTTLLGRKVLWKMFPNCKKHSLKTVNMGEPCGPDCLKRRKAEADRRAISAIIQGSAAEIIKLSMLELDKKGYKFPVQEHDALLFEVENDENYIPSIIADIQNTMENIYKLKVPLKVDIKIGNSWGECKK